MPIANRILIGGLRKYFCSRWTIRCFICSCSQVLFYRLYGCPRVYLLASSLTLVGIPLFPAKEAHSFIIVDVLRTIDDGNHFLLGTNGLTGTGVLDNFFEVALRRIPITPDLDPNFVVGDNKLLYGKSRP